MVFFTIFFVVLDYSRLYQELGLGVIRPLMLLNLVLIYFLLTKGKASLLKTKQVKLTWMFIAGETSCASKTRISRPMFSYISLEARIPTDHLLWPVRIMANNALSNLAPLFREMYSHTGRPSTTPEQLLCVSLL